MTKFYRWGRRCATIAAVGMIFQTTGCTFNGQELAVSLLGSILQNLVSTFVFGSFNLIP